MLEFLQGDLLLDLKNFEKAIECYSSILGRRAESVAYSNRALARWELGDLEGAVRDYQQGLAIDPADASILYNLGRLYAEKQDLECSAEWYEKALQQAPRHIRARIALGEVEMERGEWGRAYAHFQTALKIEPGNEVAKRFVRRIEEEFEIE